MESSQGPLYCSTTEADSATATGATVTSTLGSSTPTETGSQVMATSQAGATTTAKAGGVEGLIVPIGGVLAGAVGIAAFVL